MKGMQFLVLMKGILVLMKGMQFLVLMKGNSSWFL